MGHGIARGGVPSWAMRSPARVLGEMLVQAGHLRPAQRDSALSEQRETGERLGRILLRSSTLTESQIYSTLALQLGLPFHPDPLSAAPEATAIVRPEVARAHHLFPLQVTRRTLHVAMADPLNLRAVDDLRFETGLRIEPAVATPAAVASAIDRVYGSRITALLGALPPEFTGIAQDDAAGLEKAARAMPVVRLVDHLLEEAVAQGASDLHLEPCEGSVRVRIRVDGLLRTVVELPSATQRALISRLKVMANMDISVRRVPQDGGFVLGGGEGTKTVRVSTLPAQWGEKAVLRVLDPGQVPRGLDALGLSPDDLSTLRRQLATGRGVILAAGPTGSGKSSTLFGALAEIDGSRLNVVTLEDPVEYRLPHATQVQIHARSGLGFAEVLRSILRQDPDVIMVGEIRDRETAEIAMAAAVTGHLVLSSIHTVDAPGAIVRLLHMGVPAHLVAAGLSGVVSQRLVRRVCAVCRGRKEGCSRCHEGFRGRTGIFQVLSMTDELRGAVVDGAPLGELGRLAARAGMRNLEEDARRTVAEGVTTPGETARVIRGLSGLSRPCSVCGSTAPSQALACPGCGRVLRRRCSCGQELQAGWRFCPACIRPTEDLRERSGPGRPGLQSP